MGDSTHASHQIRPCSWAQAAAAVRDGRSSLVRMLLRCRSIVSLALWHSSSAMAALHFPYSSSRPTRYAASASCSRSCASSEHSRSASEHAWNASAQARSPYDLRARSRRSTLAALGQAPIMRLHDCGPGQLRLAKNLAVAFELGRDRSLTRCSRRAHRIRMHATVETDGSPDRRQPGGRNQCR